MKKILFKDISRENIGQKFEMLGQIETVKQTSGPTLMILNDGTAHFTFKAFIKPGVRAYPEVDIGDIVKVEAKINQRHDGIEAEASFMRKVNNQEKEEFKKNLNQLNEDRLEPQCKEFSIKSQMFESQKKRFIKVAKIIKSAIIEGRPILLRHNADCDGYSSAITIERAIISFMNKVTGDDRNAQFQNYKRAPSKAPFYEYEDSVKDISNWLRDRNRSGAKPPLIIITDNGSTQEDILSISQMKIYDSQIVVVDHHYPGEVKDEKVLVDKYIDAHINPYLTGYDSNISAGMLGFELARFIDEDSNNSVFIPAMSAILDHTKGTEREQYIQKAEKEGFTQDYLQILGEIVDMQSHYFRFMESREFFDDLFGNNMDMQKKIVELLEPELKLRYQAVEKVAKYYSTVKDYGKFKLITFDGERGTFRGEYPAIGKTTNHIHSVFEQESEKPIITLTYGSTFMTIRVSDGINHFSVPDFVTKVFEKIPFSNSNGGGHERAGSVRFVEYAKDDILKLFDIYLKEINNKNN
ncbi:MAG: DHH family phosphoesterase [Nanoarchaeota archaeon]